MCRVGNIYKFVRNDILFTDLLKLNFLNLRQTYTVRYWGLVGVPIIEGKQSTLCGDSECGLLRCVFYESINNGLAGNHAYGFGQTRTFLLW